MTIKETEIKKIKRPDPVTEKSEKRIARAIVAFGIGTMAAGAVGIQQFTEHSTELGQHIETMSQGTSSIFSTDEYVPQAEIAKMYNDGLAGISALILAQGGVAVGAGALAHSKASKPKVYTYKVTTGDTEK